jgi:hypothetical protein
MAALHKYKEPFDLSTIPTPVLLKAARDRNEELRELYGSHGSQKKMTRCPNCGGLHSAREMRLAVSRRCGKKRK